MEIAARRNLRTAVFCSVLALACASYRPPAEPDFEFRSRAETQTEGDVRVSAVVLSSDESKRVFNANLIGKQVQPIWIEVENRDDDEYVLMLLSIDTDYFSSSEVAWRTAPMGERGRNEKMAYFIDQHVPVVFPPGATSSGFVYTNFDPGAKAFAVDLIGEKSNKSFEFVIEVPGFSADFHAIEVADHYSADEIRDLDLAGLRAYLESLPCCVLGGDRKTPGDPMNIAVVGEGDLVLATFVRRGWDITETVRAGTVWRTAMSFVFGSQYRTSPVSPLYVFDRPQDAALQKARGTVDARNHLRLWMAPVSFQGQPVWVGQISRDIGVKLSSKTIVTHKIDPLVDEARSYLLMDAMMSQYMVRAGYVKGVGYASRKQPRYSYTLDPYFTDGLRVVLFLTEDPLAFDEIDWLSWEVPPLEVK